MEQVFCERMRGACLALEALARRVCADLEALEGASLELLVPSEAPGGDVLKWLDVLLHLSFVVEQALTVSGFPSDLYDQLISCVSEPFKLLGEHGETIEASLGYDHAELLRWRRGAIRYAAASTWVGLPSGLDEVAEAARCLGVAREQPRFLTTLEEGANDLQGLTTRAAARHRDEQLVADGMEAEGEAGGKVGGSTGELLALGVRSDAHVLSLMYAADMFFWRHCCAGEGVCSQGEQHDQGGSRDWRARSLQCARAFILVVTKLLPPHGGWERGRAEELVRRLSVQVADS